VYPELLPPVGALACLSLVVTLALILRGPLERRLAARNALRRRAETILVVVGSMLGTAIIIGALVVGDTLNFSVRQTAFQDLGPADELVTSPQLTVGDRVAADLANLRDPRVKGVLSLRADAASVATGEGGHLLADPQAQITEMDFDEASRFGGDGGVSGPTPGPGQVVLDEQLAQRLEARPGQQVTVYLYGTPHLYSIARVIPLRGVGGLADLSRARGLFIAPGTLAPLARAAQRDPVSIILVSNRGGVLDSAGLSGEVAQLLRDRLAQSLGSPTGFQVITAKKNVLEVAKAVGDSLGSLFLFIGSFSIIAGILLLVTIFSMLADERKPELGMMRAVGMRRAQLVRSYVIEGAGYGLAACLLGIFAGLAVGRAVVIVASHILGMGGPRRRGLPVVFHVTATSIANGVALGFLIGFLTVVVTSLAISRVNIIAAIRDLPSDRTARPHRLRTAIAAMLGILCIGPFLAGISRRSAISVLLFPAIASLLLSPIVRRRLGKRVGYSALAFLVLSWSLLSSVVIPDLFRGGTSGYTVLGFVLTAAATVLLTQNQELISSATRRLTDRPSQTALSVRLAVAYPLAKRNRTGLILLMYSVVVFTLVLLSVLAGLLANTTPGRVAVISGGYDLTATFNALPPGQDPVRILQSAPRSSDLTDIHRVQVGGAAEMIASGGTEVREPVIGVDEAFTAHGFLQLSRRDPRFPDDASAWRALATDPSAVIVHAHFGRLANAGPSAETARPGDLVRITPAGRTPTDKTIIGITEELSFDFGTLAEFISRRAFDTEFDSSRAISRLFMKVKPGVDPSLIAPQLEGSLLPQGFAATVATEVVESSNRQTRQFFDLIRGFLALGLLIGIAGLGVVMVRAVRERRREIGILRALGLEPSTIRVAFLSEAGFIAIEGIVIGTVLAIINTYLLFTKQLSRDNPGVHFGVPLLAIAILLVGAAVVSLGMTAWPARQASKVAPAVALRAMD
jgi:putative ABC transport system permease protein